jgi:Na+-driven multidrug efflux pump
MDAQTRSALKSIFVLWVPLAVMWIIMGVEQPVINGIIARLPEAKENLAAFGITFAIALIIEGPVIQLLTAGTALATSKRNYGKLLTFMHIMGLGLTLIHLILGATPLYSGILTRILGIPEEIARLSRISFLWMTPWTAAIGYRRLWQGVLIRYGRTKQITVTMVCRLLSIFLVLGIGFWLGTVPGAVLGGIALTLGVIVGAVASYLFVRPVVRDLIPSAVAEDEEMSWRRIIEFYTPLAFTSFITLAARPILTAGIAAAPNPVPSLAVWPVINSLLFVFHSVSLSYQEVVVAKLKSREDYRNLKLFTYILSAGVLVLFLLVALTPLNHLWYAFVAGLDEELLPLTGVPTVILVVLPAAAVFISLFRGLIVTARRTRIITKGVGVNSIILAGVVLTGAYFFPFPGAVTAAIAFTSAIVIEAVYLFFQARRRDVDFFPGSG